MALPDDETRASKSTPIGSLMTNAVNTLQAEISARNASGQGSGSTPSKPTASLPALSVSARLSATGVSTRWTTPPAKPRAALREAIHSLPPSTRDWAVHGPKTNSTFKRLPLPRDQEPVVLKLYDLTTFSLNERATAEELAKALDMLRSVLPAHRGLDPAGGLEAWMLVLQPLPRSYVLEALLTWHIENVWFPRPAEIVERVKSLTASAERLQRECRDLLKHWQDQDKTQEQNT